jgi:putative N6-adenine-specific DNA methylase
LRRADLEDAGSGWPPGGGAPQGQRRGREQAAARGKKQAGEPGGFIITNPPYGIRLGDTEMAEAGYRRLAGLRRHFSGWKLGVITDHPGFESHFGRKADSCKEITNGAIRTYFYQYERL